MNEVEGKDHGAGYGIKGTSSNGTGVLGETLHCRSSSAARFWAWLRSAP